MSLLDIVSKLSNKKPISLERRYFSNRVKEFDPVQHEVVGDSTDHDHYNCPFCLEVRGKADDDGKFYWNTVKLLGYCFKCKTVGILASDKAVHELKLDMIIRSFINHGEKEVKDMQSKINAAPGFDLDKIGNPLSPRAIDYLVNRFPMYEDMHSLFGMREVPEVGILIPFYLDGKVHSYTIRLYNPTGKMKYYINKDQDKIPYSPARILTKGNTVDEITLVEGCFDSYGALLDGYKNPIALQGLSLTQMHLFILRRLMPSKITIYLDEKEKSLDLLGKLRKSFPLVGDIKVVNTFGADPEERFLYKLANIDRYGGQEYLNKVLENFNQLKLQLGAPE